MWYTIQLNERKAQGHGSHEAFDLDEIDPNSIDWIVAPNDVDVDVDVDLFFTNDHLAELEKEATKWNVEVETSQEEEDEVGHSTKAPITMDEAFVEAPIEDVVATSITPI